VATQPPSRASALSDVASTAVPHARAARFYLFTTAATTHSVFRFHVLRCRRRPLRDAARLRLPSLWTGHLLRRRRAARPVWCARVREWLVGSFLFYRFIACVGRSPRRMPQPRGTCACLSVLSCVPAVQGASGWFRVAKRMSLFENCFNVSGGLRVPLHFIHVYSRRGMSHSCVDRQVSRPDGP